MSQIQVNMFFLLFEISQLKNLFFTKSGHVIVITGIPYGNPKGWFLIKFTEAASKRQALHFSVRFEPYFIVVRNSMNENNV